MICAKPLVDRDLATQAVMMALPLIEAAMADPKINDNRYLHIVVMAPWLSTSRRDADFEKAILHEHSVGDRTRWDADYAAFARAKARAAWNAEAGSRIGQFLQPCLLQADYNSIPGSAALDRIVVGVSGMRPCYDEAIASTVAACLKALAKDRAHGRHGMHSAQYPEAEALALAKRRGVPGNA